MVHQFMKYWPTCRYAECLKIHFSFGEKASDFRVRPILGELLYSLRLRTPRFLGPHDTLPCVLIKRGKVVECDRLELPSGEMVRTLPFSEAYRYLGVLQR